MTQEHQLMSWLQLFICRCDSYTRMRRAMQSIVKLSHALSIDKEAAVAGHQIFGAWGSCETQGLNISFFIWGDLAEFYIGDEDSGCVLAVNDCQASFAWNGNVQRLYKKEQS